MTTSESDQDQFREHSSVVLETARLRLRKPTLADVKAIAVMANDRRVAENTRRLPYPYTQAHAEAFIQAQAKGDETVFLIELKRDRTALGLCGLAGPASSPELGYWLGHRHWGNGYGSEAARAVIAHGFTATPAYRLTAGARVTNPASRRILEANGFRWTGVELHRMQALGYSTPVDLFALDRDVWASLQTWQDVRDVA